MSGSVYNRPVPANLTPQYKEAEEKFRKARDAAEKRELLEEMLRLIPKHKGTEKLQADLKKRLAKLKHSSQGPAQSSQVRPFYQIEREGVGRVVVAGPPNSGKSQLVCRLTGARPEVADYPFTTRLPTPGMMEFEDVQIQLIDTPALAPETLESWQLQMVEQADVALLVFDVQDGSLLEQTDFILRILGERGISIAGADRPHVIVLGNKMDGSGAGEDFEVWSDLYRGEFQARPFSSQLDSRVEELRGELFQSLNLVRVYTRRPGQRFEPGSAPYVLKRGATPVDVAESIHKDLRERFRSARLWRGDDSNGILMEVTQAVEDGDILEIQTS